MILEGLEGLEGLERLERKSMFDYNCFRQLVCRCIDVRMTQNPRGFSTNSKSVFQFFGF